jgi:hypothetical protein
MINAIQIILLCGILLIGIYWYKKIRSTIIDSLLIMILLSLGILFVILPELSSKIANYLGVGRGVDLIFYISQLLFAFLILKLYAKIRRLEQMITITIRDRAINETQDRKGV